MKVKTQLCDLCLGDGRENIAQFQYTTEDGTYDVCKRHVKEVANYGYTTNKIKKFIKL